MTSVPVRYPAALVGASACFGSMAALVAHVDARGLAAACVINLAGGLVLLTFAWARGGRSSASRWAWPALALLEGGNAAFYFVALKLAPTAPVVALHLMAPVLLLAVTLGRRQRAPHWTDAATFALLAAAVALAAAQGGNADGSGNALLGLALALASAACIAGLIVVVRHAAGDSDPVFGGGVQLTGAGLVLLPALLLWPMPAAESVAQLAGIGVALMAPAFVLLWLAARHVPGTVMATVGLSEPFFSAVVAAVVFGAAVTGLQIAAVVCAIGAAWLQVRRS